MELKKGTKIHFIAIGGSIMHNLAIALKENGYIISGSDDHIGEPSLSRLKSHNLLPETIGWNPDKITNDLEAVILGMHARIDNPELLKAQELGLKIFSFPEFIYNQSEDKQRIVIAGSHGKTTVTSMVMHVLKFCNRKFDYAVGAIVEGFDTMVQLSDAPIIVIEGDEYPSSPIDLTPKFLHYHHHIGLITGISWDHVNIFKTFDDYKKQFELFADKTPKSGTLIYYENDKHCAEIGSKERSDILTIEYDIPKYKIINGNPFLITDYGNIPLQVFGDHNFANIRAAKLICNRICVSDLEFYQAIQSFKGASMRLELIRKNESTSFYRDFAHAPSKLKASTEAVKGLFPNKKLVACFELHTFSSLNKEFLSEYKNTFTKADEPIVYFNPKTLEHKKLPPITKQDIIEGFQLPNLQVFDNSNEMLEFLMAKNWENANLLMMSSGNFDGINFQELADIVIQS
jgi:UDP-N-acetylmuramate: L-alanyl-gamma-D-glutamyl-meso-diaminopimelate ligase